MLGLVALASIGCEDRNRGIPPDGKGLYFPSGVALDPRVPADRPARWLFVLNGNSDLVFNAGTLVPVDLEEFFAAWMLDPDRCFGVRGDGTKIEADATFCAPGPCPGCESFVSGAPVIGDVGAELTDDVMCRRNAYKPQVIECEDTFFARDEAAVRLGNFGTGLTGWTREVVTDAPADEGHLFMAVRGDPSVTWVRITDQPLADAEDRTRGLPVLSCGQGEDSGLYDPQRCAGTIPPTEDGKPVGEAHLLKWLRNDPDSVRIPSEPSNILATPGSPYVLVTHATRPALSMIDMDGQYDDTQKQSKDGTPAIIQLRSVFEFNGLSGGGWGMAVRPCDPDNAPALTYGAGPDGQDVGCQRPMIYAAFRSALYVARVFIAEVDPLNVASVDGVLAALAEQIEAVEAKKAMTSDPDELADLDAQLAELMAQLADYQDQRDALADGAYDQGCLLASQIAGDALYDDDAATPDTQGRFLCDARLFGAGLFRAAAFEVGTANASALLGDIAFSRDGNRMFAVQTNPGGLAYIDTSLNDKNQTRDQAAGLLELCASPTAMRVFYSGEQEYAAVTCYKPSELFIVDLGQVRVVGNVTLGNGPHPMAVDAARQVMYIANTLDKTVSVVDLSPKRSTRFVEIARIGRQVPYNR